MIRQQYFISGKVQGVEFRFFVEQIATKMNIKGYVKNLDDGRVEIVAFLNTEDHAKLFEKLLREGNGYSKIEKIDKKLLDNKYPFNFKDFRTYY